MDHLSARQERILGFTDRFEGVRVTLWGGR